MIDGPQWPKELEQAAALLRAVPLTDPPDWWIGLTRGGDVRDEWAWVWAAEVLAAFHVELLLPYLKALRSLALERKQHTLDRVGERLAIERFERPTLSDCRAAIAEPDEAPRRRSVYTDERRTPVSANIDTELTAFVVDALGCAEESLSRTSEKTTGWEEFDETAYTDQDRVVTSRWESATCTVEVVRTETYFPSDVNSPARESLEISVSGARRGGARLTMHARIGDRTIGFDVDTAPDERDRILATVWRAYGRISQRPTDAWKW